MISSISFLSSSSFAIFLLFCSDNFLETPLVIYAKKEVIFSFNDGNCYTLSVTFALFALSLKITSRLITFAKFPEP